MTSETLARAGTLGRPVALVARAAYGRDRPGGGVSTALTLTPHRRCIPERNRSIPTIPDGRFDSRLVNVSAVDTGPHRSKSGVLAAWPGASVTGPPPPTPARRLRWGPVVRVRLRLCLESARVCLLHEGRDLLVKGCAYCTKAPPTPSTPDPRPVEPHSRAVHPDDAVSHHSDPASPLRQAEAAVLRPAYPLHRRLEMS